LICETLRKKYCKKANKDGRKVGRIDSIPIKSTQIVCVLVDATYQKSNWETLGKNSARRGTRRAEQVDEST